MGINKIILRLWSECKIDQLNYRMNIGMVPQEVAKVQIELLKELIEDFNLKELHPNEEIFYHDQI